MGLTSKTKPPTKPKPTVTNRPREGVTEVAEEAGHQTWGCAGPVRECGREPPPLWDRYITRPHRSSAHLYSDTAWMWLFLHVPCSDFQMHCQKLISFFQNTERKRGKLKRHNTWSSIWRSTLADQEAKRVTAARATSPWGLLLGTRAPSLTLSPRHLSVVLQV